MKIEFLIIFAVMSIGFHAAFADPPRSFSESFDNFDPSRFRTEIPNKSTEVRDGVMWTHGESGRKYPPMVKTPDLDALTQRGALFSDARFPTLVSQRSFPNARFPTLTVKHRSVIHPGRV